MPEPHSGYPIDRPRHLITRGRIAVTSRCKDGGFALDQRQALGERALQLAEGIRSVLVFAFSSVNVATYIENQERHHAKRSFRDEYVALLKKFHVEYDPAYLFTFSDDVD